MPNEHSELDFIYKSVPITDSVMRIWMTVPEFVSQMRFLLSSKHHISNEDVLQAMEEICECYDQMKKSKIRFDPSIPLGTMRRGRNQLRRALGRDSIQD